MQYFKFYGHVITAKCKITQVLCAQKPLAYQRGGRGRTRGGQGNPSTSGQSNRGGYPSTGGQYKYFYNRSQGTEPNPTPQRGRHVDPESNPPTAPSPQAPTTGSPQAKTSPVIISHLCSTLTSLLETGITVAGKSMLLTAIVTISNPVTSKCMHIWAFLDTGSEKR